MILCKQTPKDEYHFTLPSSKSISNRLLVIRHLSNTRDKILNLSDSEDTICLKKCLQILENKGFDTEKLPNISAQDTKNISLLQSTEDKDVRLKCKDGDILQHAADKGFTYFNTHNAGTTTRFLLSILATEQGNWVLDADQRMNQRPIKDLIDALKQMGARIQTSEGNKIFPLKIQGSQLKANGLIQMKENLSSQLISSLILISPRIEGGLEIKMPTSQVSMPYINMTIQLVKKYGIDVEIKDNILVCRSLGYKFKESKVEDDYSALCFIMNIAIVGKINRIILNQLQTSTLQGDFKAIKHFQTLGLSIKNEESYSVLGYNSTQVPADKVINFDLKDMPDVFPALSVCAFFSGKRVIFSNLQSTIVKESDRLHAMQLELNKIDNRCRIKDNDFIIEPCDNIDEFLDDIKDKKICFSSHNDHRIAMALSSICLICREIEIDNTDCVAKSWRDYWQQTKDLFNLKED